MATYQPPKRGAEYIFYVGLVSQADAKLLKGSATLAAGDVQVSKDGGAFANLTTLPAVTPAAGKGIKVTLSATEMTADNVTVVFSDAAGAEWCDLVVNIQTSAQQIDDLATQTSVNTIDDFLDTEVAAILAAVDTEVGDIKTKTDFLPSATAGATGGLFIAGTNAATTITTALTTTFTGNLTGSVASVTGAVGSVTGLTAANLDATISSRATPAQVNTEVVDALNVDTYAEPGQGAPAATTTLAAKINYLYKAWRNKKTETATTYSLFADDATTVDQKATVSDDGTTATIGEIATGP